MAYVKESSFIGLNDINVNDIDIGDDLNSPSHSPTHFVDHGHISNDSQTETHRQTLHNSSSIEAKENKETNNNNTFFYRYRWYFWIFWLGLVFVLLIFLYLEYLYQYRHYVELDEKQNYGIKSLMKNFRKLQMSAPTTST